MINSGEDFRASESYIGQKSLLEGIATCVNAELPQSDTQTDLSGVTET